MKGNILVKWFSEDSIYGKAMKVIFSDHPDYEEGCRFDFGFLQIASSQGYAITIWPLDVNNLS